MILTRLVIGWLFGPRVAGKGWGGKEGRYREGMVRREGRVGHELVGRGRIKTRIWRRRTIVMLGRKQVRKERMLNDWRRGERSYYWWRRRYGWMMVMRKVIKEKSYRGKEEKTRRKVGRKDRRKGVREGIKEWEIEGGKIEEMDKESKEGNTNKGKEG